MATDRSLAVANSITRHLCTAFDTDCWRIADLGSGHPATSLRAGCAAHPVTADAECVRAAQMVVGNAILTPYPIDAPGGC